MQSKRLPCIREGIGRYSRSDRPRRVEFYASFCALFSKICTAHDPIVRYGGILFRWCLILSKWYVLLTLKSKDILQTPELSFSPIMGLCSVLFQLHNLTINTRTAESCLTGFAHVEASNTRLITGFCSAYLFRHVTIGLSEAYYYGIGVITG